MASATCLPFIRANTASAASFPSHEPSWSTNVRLTIARPAIGKLSQQISTRTSGKRGRQPDDSEAAIQTCVTMKVLFGRTFRQTTGFVESLLRLIGLNWDVPDFSALSRCQKTLKGIITCRGSDGPLHPLIDSTAITVEGEGEWNARKHGGSKRRVWRKTHIRIDEKTLEIRVAEFTTSDVGDAPMLPELLDKIPPITKVVG